MVGCVCAVAVHVRMVRWIVFQFSLHVQSSFRILTRNWLSVCLSLSLSLNALPLFLPPSSLLNHFFLYPLKPKVQYNNLYLYCMCNDVWGWFVTTMTVYLSFSLKLFSSPLSLSLTFLLPTLLTLTQSSDEPRYDCAAHCEAKRKSWRPIYRLLIHPSWNLCRQFKSRNTLVQAGSKTRKDQHKVKRRASSYDQICVKVAEWYNHWWFWCHCC